MKNEKIAGKSGKKKTSAASTATPNKKGRTGSTDSASIPNATAKAKPKAGRGLANEGTIVSYDEER